MTRRRIVIHAFTLLAACGELSRTPGVDAGSPTLRDRCTVCDPTYAYCIAGECRRTCADGLGSLDCLPTEICSFGACIPHHQPTCDEVPCNTDQTCVSTYCVTESDGPCVTTADCRHDELCHAARRTCVGIPRCGPDGTCRLGTDGAVCNRDPSGEGSLFTQFQRDACLLGRCTSNDHCPAPLTCEEIGAELAGLGVCR